MTPARIVKLNTPMPVRMHFADTFTLDGADCPLCCELAVDAWERMTTGGLKVPCLPGYPYAHAVEAPLSIWASNGPFHYEWR